MFQRMGFFYELFVPFTEPYILTKKVHPLPENEAKLNGFGSDFLISTTGLRSPGIGGTSGVGAALGTPTLTGLGVSTSGGNGRGGCTVSHAGPF